MKKTEIKYHAERGTHVEDYQYLEVTQETDNNRQYIRFALMEQRWRDPKSAADYLRWAANEVEKLC